MKQGAWMSSAVDRCASGLLAVLVVCVSAGCGVVAPDDLEQSSEATRAREEIVGGILAKGDPAVVLLARGWGGHYQGYCTGTLIAPRTVLTAAHCVIQSTAYVLFGNSESAPTRVIKVAEQIPHPAYDEETIANDIALLRLETAADGVAPVALSTHVLSSADVGTLIRVVGFGASNPQTQGGSGIKREATYPLRKVLQSQFESGSTGKQVCFGDSGGPALLVPPGAASNVEVVAGVASFVTHPSCLGGGYHTRVDAYVTSWIDPTMKNWEMPSCDPDFACLTGCTPVDQDCVCVMDGQCVADCRFPERDPDCPADCGLNGVCSEAVCPNPDVDCVAVGERCTTDLDCPERTCIGDPQRAFTYCSQPCADDAACAAFGMVCDASVCRYAQKPTAAPKEPCSEAILCLGGTFCAGPESDRRCLYACTPGGSCASATDTCVTDATSGLRYCEPAAPVAEAPPVTGEDTPPAAVQAPSGAQSAAPASCAATGGSTGGSAMALLMLLVMGWAARLARARSRC